ncbi:MAG: cytochrome c biogenesis protein CcsA [Gemmatimonadetes bacterium]|nr:cytochrome c biogenesis protein CcsA [Gemmatimonadota bacterium]
MIHLVALVFYFLAGSLWLYSLLAEGGKRTESLAPWAAALAAVVHAVALTRYSLQFGALPLVGLSPSLSSLALVLGVSLVALLALGEAKRVGLLVIPLILVLEGSALAIGVRPAGQALAFRGPWFALHVTLAFVGYAGLAIAFAAGLMYLIQFHELKSKRLGRVFRFVPPLGTLDRLGRLALAGGFTTLTVSLVVGWAWAVQFGHPVGLTDPQVIWGLLTWLVFVAVLVARGSGAERSRRAAVTVVVGFGVVVVSYVVLRVTLVAGGAFL